MNSIIRKNKAFLLPYLIFFVVTGGVILLFNKSEIHLYLNQFHSPFWDYFFKYGTALGDGYFIGFVFLVLLFIKFRYALANAVIYLSSGILVQVFKRFITPDALRPVKFFEGSESLHLIEGLNYHSFRSFPSGHTATAFGFFLLLGLMSKNRYVKFVTFVLAFIVGYSRVYLSLHFLRDIWFGSLLGVVCALVAWYYIAKSPKKWMDKSLLRLK